MDLDTAQKLGSSWCPETEPKEYLDLYRTAQGRYVLVTHSLDERSDLHGVTVTDKQAAWHLLAWNAPLPDELARLIEDDEI